MHDIACAMTSMRSNELKLFHRIIMLSEWRNETERSHPSSSIEICDLEHFYVDLCVAVNNNTGKLEPQKSRNVIIEV